jgi:hypothetical protein
VTDGTWVVWGPLINGSQLVIDEGLSAAEARESADRRNATAAKFSFVGGYLALPDGQDPNEELT